MTSNVDLPIEFNIIGGQPKEANLDIHTLASLQASREACQALASPIVTPIISIANPKVCLMNRSKPKACSSRITQHDTITDSSNLPDTRVVNYKREMSPIPMRRNINSDKVFHNFVRHACLDQWASGTLDKPERHKSKGNITSANKLELAEIDRLKEEGLHLI